MTLNLYGQNRRQKDIVINELTPKELKFINPFYGWSDINFSLLINHLLETPSPYNGFSWKNFICLKKFKIDQKSKMSEDWLFFSTIFNIYNNIRANLSHLMKSLKELQWLIHNCIFVSPCFSYLKTFFYNKT